MVMATLLFSSLLSSSLLFLSPLLSSPRDSRLSWLTMPGRKACGSREARDMGRYGEIWGDMERACGSREARVHAMSAEL